MRDDGHRNDIVALRRQWVTAMALAGLALSAAIAFFFGVITKKCWDLSPVFAASCGLLVLIAWCLRHKLFRVTATDISVMLDANCPELEESSGLLLSAPGQLSGIAALQHQITGRRLAGIRDPLSAWRKISIPLLVAGVLLLAALISQQFSYSLKANEVAVPAKALKNIAVLPVAGIASATVTVLPPAYTRKPARTQTDLNIRAEGGALISWKIMTSRPVRAVGFIINGSSAGTFTPDAPGGQYWQGRYKADSPALYQIVIDKSLSPLYTLATIADQPPAVQVIAPQQYSSIEPGMPETFDIKTTLTDDYGIVSAVLNMTIASGNGEAVKFKTSQSTLRGFSAGHKNYRLQQPLSVSTLHMQSGDQLFFYVEATDNNGQQSRTDTYIVDLPDTAGLMRLEGLGNPLDLKPEFFRSERQIIIETEQLLRDRDTLRADIFKTRSNNLGIDQKLLRQRYGKFLGDETDAGEPADNGLSDLSNFSNAEKLKEAYTDKHDNAEDATFYSSDTKARLKETLNQMWEAEIRLRTFTPREALPFAYKALRLLKDLQQQSRAYVAKTNHKTTPLDLKKRLTGDLSKIPQAALHEKETVSVDPLLSVTLSLFILASPGELTRVSLTRLGILEKAAVQLEKKARQDPEKFRSAVEALQVIINAINSGKPIRGQVIVTAQQGLQELLPVPMRLPGAVSTNGSSLADRYFNNLLKQQP